MDNAGLLIPISLFTMIAVTCWIIFSSLRRFMVAKLQAGVQSRLVDRIDSSQALLSYVETEAGRSFLRSLNVERERESSPYRSILTGVQCGILLIVFGLALLLLHAIHMLPADGFFVMGALPLALGIGFLLAAGATYILSSRFGLLEAKHPFRADSN